MPNPHTAIELTLRAVDRARDLVAGVLTRTGASGVMHGHLTDALAELDTVKRDLLDLQRRLS